MKSVFPEDECVQEITQRKDQKCCATLMLPNLLNIYFNLNLSNYFTLFILPGHAVAQLVEALRYKPEGRGFDSR